jgi:hypothetical protein
VLFHLRLYDDGGLTLLLPYILKTRAKFSKCQLRVFFLANKMNTLDEEARSMAALLVKAPPLANASTPKSVVVTAMIEILLTIGICETIPQTIITVEIAHRHLMLIRNAETHLTIDSITLFLKKLPKKF